MVEGKNITAILYDRYYRTDHTPPDLVSSHWREYHKEIKLDFSGDEMDTLKGVGFGYESNVSWYQKIPNWMTNISYLGILPNRMDLLRLIPIARKIAKKMNCSFTDDCSRQVCTLALLKVHMPPERKIRVINIGDGHGFLSALIKEVFPNSTICLVDLGKTLLFQHHFCSKAYPQKKHCLILEQKNFQEIDADFIYCPAENLSLLDSFSFDVAINIASMQEMNEKTVEYYFNFLRKHLVKNNLFYCCNRIEKHMPDGEISSFFLYPWDKNDRYLIDENCPWQKFFFDIHQTFRGPKIFNVRLPLINYFDGETWHRLSVLKTSN